MATKLIELEDGILMEVAAPDDEIEQISGGGVDQVNAHMDKIKPLLLKACQPIASVWSELNKDLYIDQVQVSLGLGFEAEGNVFITRAKGSANLNITLTMKPKPDNGG